MNLTADPCQQVKHVLVDGLVFPVPCTVKISNASVCVCVCLNLASLYRKQYVSKDRVKGPFPHTHTRTNMFDFRFMSQSCKKPIQFRFVQI